MSCLFWGATVSLCLLFFLVIIQRILTLKQCINVFTEGLKSVAGAMFVLLLAWTLGDSLNAIHIGKFIVQALGIVSPLSPLSIFF